MATVAFVICYVRKNLPDKPDPVLVAITITAEDLKHRYQEAKGEALNRKIWAKIQDEFEAVEY